MHTLRRGNREDIVIRVDDKQRTGRPLLLDIVDDGNRWNGMCLKEEGGIILGAIDNAVTVRSIVE